MKTKQPKIKTWVLMFMPQFHDLVKRGLKCKTIRPVRKRPPALGDHLSLRVWAAKPYRSKQREIAVGVVTEVAEVDLRPDGEIRVNGSHLVKAVRSSVAVGDGFKDTDDMLECCESRYGLPFRGTLIRWKIA